VTLQFQQYRDINAAQRNKEPEWVKENCWGEVQEFLSFMWEGVLKCVAVIKVATIKSGWIPGSEPGTGPQLLFRSPQQPAIQVVDLKAVISVAGRVPRTGESGMIVFDISGGLLEPKGVDDPE
jgi:hypothetical protein